MPDLQNEEIIIKKPIFTLGHGKLLLPDFIRILAINLIQTVIDVRSKPYSRIAPQFNKSTLEQALSDAFIIYRYAGDYLGGYPDGVKPDKNTLIDYKQMAQTPKFKRGIQRVIELSQQERCLLLCAEEDPYSCHRHKLIVPALEGTDIQVIHLRHNGRRETANPPIDPLF